MKKQEFLDELKCHLKVLQEEEQEDILDEYSQHIEMKIANGLSEEEAIKDFGSIHALAGEILEAYHVNPEYEQERSKGASRRSLFAGGQTEEPESRRHVGAVLKETVACAGRAGKKGGHQILVWTGWLLRLLGTPFRKGKMLWCRWLERRKEIDREGGWIETEDCAEGPAELERKDEALGNLILLEDGLKTGEKTDGTSRRSVITGKHQRKPERSRAVSWLQALGGTCRRGSLACVRGIRQVLRWVVEAGFWCCRLAWNCCVVLASAFSAFAGLVFLFLFGTMAVLWGQGFPFAGIVLGCLGAVLCFGSLAVFGGTFFWRKRHE